MSKWQGFEHGMGIGGWLTNYKRFNVLPEDMRMDITIGDMEHFATYITEQDVAYIASLGMDHIRLGFDQIVVEEAPYTYRAAILDKIEEFFGWCRDHGLNAVLNLHKSIGNYCDIKEERELLDDAELQDRFVALWTMLEKRFAAYPNVAFELLNELRDVDPERWNVLATRTVDAIRALSKTRPIVIGSTCWNSVTTVGELKVFDDPNVIYTFHMYEPFGFTHQRGVLQKRTCYYNREMPYPCDIERYRDYLRVAKGVENAYEGYERMDARFVEDYMQPAVDFCKAHPDKILWLGEFGSIRHAKTEWRENYMRDVIRVCQKNGMPYCVWNYLSTPYDGNRFSLVDDDTRRILSPELARIIRGEVE